MPRTLGIDYGSHRVGLALSDPLGMLSTPLCVLDGKVPDKCVREVCEICAREDVETIVVGLPLNMNGTRGPAAESAERFAAALRAKSGLPVETLDERLTTRLVERSLLETDTSRSKRRKVRDALAAQVILQNWLDSRERTA